MLDRRTLLMTSAASIAMGVVPGGSNAAEQAPKADVTSDRLNKMFDAFVKEQLDHIPELATSLGLDVGPRAAERSELADRSRAEAQRLKALTAEQLRRLRSFDRGSLDAKDAVSYDVVLTD